MEHLVEEANKKMKQEDKETCHEILIKYRNIFTKVENIQQCLLKQTAVVDKYLIDSLGVTAFLHKSHCVFFLNV